MALTVGAVIFVVIVIGGMGSLAGAFVASVGAGRDRDASPSAATIRSPTLFAALGLADHARDASASRSGASSSRRSPPILPYLLLVLILIFRPKGLLGTREG